MYESRHRVRAPGTPRILAGLIALAMAPTGCSPAPGPGPGEGGVTSKVPEIAKRQKHMADLLKKGESKATPAAKPR